MTTIREFFQLILPTRSYQLFYLTGSQNLWKHLWVIIKKNLGKPGQQYVETAARKRMVVFHKLYIDFCQPYNSIYSEQISNASAEFPVPRKLINLIKICQNVRKASVRVDYKHSEYFEIASGLKQEDPFSPHLFLNEFQKIQREKCSLPQSYEINTSLSIRGRY